MLIGGGVLNTLGKFNIDSKEPGWVAFWLIVAGLIILDVF